MEPLGRRTSTPEGDLRVAGRAPLGAPPRRSGGLRWLHRCLVLLGLVSAMSCVGPSRTWAESGDERSFDASESGIVWGLSAFEFSLLGASLAAAQLDGGEPLVFLPASTLLAAAVIAAPFGSAYLAEHRGWPSDPPLVSTALLHAGLGGYAIGCGISAVPLGNYAWDPPTFPQCSGRVLPWLIGALAGAGAASYFALRGDDLLRDPAQHSAARTAAYGTYLAPLAAAALLMLVPAAVAATKSLLYGGSYAADDNQLFPSGRGYLVAVGITDLVLIGGSILLAEWRR